MTAVKFAISMPRETMNRVDRAAKRLGMTRSRYIATVLDKVAQRERDAVITARVNEILEEIEQDLEGVDDLLAARHNAGTEW